MGLAHGFVGATGLLRVKHQDVELIVGREWVESGLILARARATSFGWGRQCEDNIGEIPWETLERIARWNVSSNVARKFESRCVRWSAQSGVGSYLTNSAS